jgi:hypothetical protein
MGKFLYFLFVPAAKGSSILASFVIKGQFPEKFEA